MSIDEHSPSPASAAAATIGKYRLIAELGHGGMAEVFLAVVRGPAGFNKLVVVKQIRPQLAEDPEFLSMFLDEARLAARLAHPNVVQTNEVGQEHGRYFIAMEYLEGQALNRIVHRLDKTNGLTLSMHLKIASEVCAGLQHAHELTDYDGTPLGVVHRDVTPHNIFVTYEGQVKVVDFGIAKALNSSAETRTGVLKGKVAYMAPEQAQGERVDQRADVFSVGVLLWHTAAGKRLWKGVPDLTILQRLLAGEIPKPSTVRPVDPRLEAIIMRALSPDRERRHATAAELQADIDRLIDELGERVTLRDIGRVVAQAFDKERAKIKSLVEEQLRSPASVLPFADQHTSTSSSLDRVTSTSISSVVNSRAPGSSAPPGGGSSSFTVHSALSANTTGASSIGPRKGLVAGLALAGGAALAVVFWVMTRGASVPQSNVVTASPPPIVTASATAAAPRAPTTVELRVTATPAEARIFIDDKPVTGNPYKGSVEQGTAHSLRVEAEGYVPVTRPVSSEKDLDLELALQKAPSPGKPSSGRRPVGAAAQREKDDDVMRPMPKPKRTLDTSNPYGSP